MSIPSGNASQTAAKSAQAANNKATNKLITTTAGKTAGAAGILAALWLMRESYNGAKDEWVEHYQHFEDNTNMELWGDRRGNYSGQPTMDNWAVKLREHLAYGVGGTRMLYHKWKTYTEGFVNDVLLPNLFPLSIAAGGGYIALGPKNRQAIAQRIKKSNFPIVKEFGKLLGLGAKEAGKGVGSMLNGYSRFTAKNPLASFAIIGLGLFGANRFSRVYSGEEQDDFFQDFTSPPQGGH